MIRFRFCHFVVAVLLPSRTPLSLAASPDETSTAPFGRSARGAHITVGMAVALGIVGYAHYFPFGSTCYPARQKVYAPYA
jgi:hypothetical protein